MRLKKVSRLGQNIFSFSALVRRRNYMVACPLYSVELMLELGTQIHQGAKCPTSRYDQTFVAMEV